MYDPARGYPRVVPYVLYDDPRAAAAWLEQVFEMREVIRLKLPGGGYGHVELELQGFIVMLGLKSGRFGETSSINLVFVADVDAICKRALEAGGQMVDEVRDQPWGLRQAVISDPEGQRWEVSQHLRDVEPADWGAELIGAMPG